MENEGANSDAMLTVKLHKQAVVRAEELGVWIDDPDIQIRKDRIAVRRAANVTQCPLDKAD